MRPISRGWIYALSAVLLFVVAIVLVLANLQWFRGPIERALTSATGREAHIRGELKLSPWFPPRVNFGDVSLANAEWSKDPQMLTARRLAIAPRVWRLIGGQYAFRSIEADGLKLIIETDRNNRQLGIQTGG